MGRRELRELVFCILFRLEFNDPADMEDQAAYFTQELKEEKGLDSQEAEEVLGRYRRVKELLPEIDDILRRTATGWKLSRMGKVDLTLLRLAVFEMRYDDDVPEKVAINEAVELSKKFGGDESPVFINGVLAKLAQEKSEKQKARLSEAAGQR